MENDHLKDIWKQDEIFETPKISLEKQREIRFPLEMLRQNMKNMFFKTLISFFLLIVFLFYIGSFDNEIKLSWIAFLLVYLIIVIYYFSKFFGLYKKLSSEIQFTYNFINELRFDLKLNFENLKSYYVATIPILFAEFLIISKSSPHLNSKVFILIIFFILGVLIGFFRIKYDMKNKFYRYIQQIEKVIAELE